MDSLKRMVDERDRRTNTERMLSVTQRAPRSRRVCGRCWRMLDDDPRAPARTCPECGGALHEVTV